MKRLALVLLLQLLSFDIHSSDKLGDAAEQEFEGWAWCHTLNFSILNEDMDKIHKNMAEEVQQLESFTGKKSNVALLRLGLVVEENNKHQYRPISCFNNYVFVSGYLNREKCDSLAWRINKKKKLDYKINPGNYSSSFSLSSIFKTQARFFNLSEQDGTCIAEKKFSKERNFKIKLTNHYNRLKSAQNIKDADEPSSKLNGAIEDFKGFYSDTEKKICFFLKDSLEGIPYYWNFRVLKRLEGLLNDLEAFYINKYGNEDELKISKKIVKTEKNISDTIEKVKTEFGDFLEGRKGDYDGYSAKFLTNLRDHYGTRQRQQTEKEKNKKVGDIPLLSTKTSSTNNLQKKIDELLQELECIEKLRQKDPFNAPFKNDNSDEYLARLKRLLNPKESKSTWFEDKEYLRSGLFFEEGVNREWLRKLQEAEAMYGHHVKGIILHLYTKKDICTSCAMRLTREHEIKDGFIKKLKSIFATFSEGKGRSIPFFRLLTSCSEIREGSIKSGDYERRKGPHTFSFTNSLDPFTLTDQDYYCYQPDDPKSKGRKESKEEIKEGKQEEEDEPSDSDDSPPVEEKKRIYFFQKLLEKNG